MSQIYGKSTAKYNALGAGQAPEEGKVTAGVNLKSGNENSMVENNQPVAEALWGKCSKEVQNSWRKSKLQCNMINEATYQGHIHCFLRQLKSHVNHFCRSINTIMAAKMCKYSLQN